MSAREDLIADTFVELADSLVAGFEVTDLLDRLVLRAVELLDADAAGIMLADPKGELQVLAASSHDVRLLELFELQGDSGPCLDSFRSGEAVTPPDRAAMRACWPAFAARTESVGYRSAQAVPMRLRDQVIGAMDVFRLAEGALVGSQLKLARALADVASIALIAERTISARELVADQLQEALDSRVVLEQAKGMLAARTGVDVDRAFAQLRDHARRTGQPLRDVAAAVVAQRGSPPRR